MTEQPPNLHKDDDVEEFEDFDAWREQQQAKRGGGKRVKVFGRVVTLPTTLPLGLQLRMDELKDSSDIADIKKVVGFLYGDDALDHWLAGGVDFDDLAVLMGYGVAHAHGQAITLDEAREKVAEAKAAEAAKQGKARGSAPKKPRKKGSGKR